MKTRNPKNSGTQTHGVLKVDDRRPTRWAYPKGFALVVTVSLMVLLALLAVGMLGLSAVALRSSGRDQAMAQARSNARMALILALGELQKHAGTDKAVTAPLGLIGKDTSNPRLTGVWKSWDHMETNGQGTPDYAAEKQNRFQAWLVSDTDAAAVRNRTYEGPKGEKVLLVGPQSLGVESPPPQDMVEAGRVAVADSNDKATGAFAWHVSDESCKARINAYRDPTPNDYPWRKSSLLAGHRPEASVVSAADGSSLNFLQADSSPAGFNKARDMAAKLVSLPQFELLPGGGPMGKFRHHVTPYSHGLLTDARHGGLKQDLSSMFETAQLPAIYHDKRLYESTHGMSGPSDPYWSALRDYYSVGKDASMNSSEPVYRRPPREAVALADKDDVPHYFNAGPVIARVEMLFSVVVRDAHGPWAPSRTGLSQHTRMIHLLYSPIITLHNPYNVSLQFDQLDLDINGIPIAFNFHVNGLPQNGDMVPYNNMYVNQQDRTTKSFMLSIANWTSFSSGSSSPIVMKPGQTLVCGPYLDGGTIFGNAGKEGEKVFFDYSNNLTGNSNARAKCKPGFLGTQVSFDVDWLTPSHMNPVNSTDGNRGVLIVKPDDRFHVQYQMMPNEYNGSVTDRMNVKAKLMVGRSAIEIGGLEFQYDTRSIRRLYPEVHRFPDARSRPNELTVESLWESNSTPIRDQVRVKSFALLSARARTANGGVYDSVSRDPRAKGENLLTDGILAGIPLLHHNPARTPTVVDLKRDLPGRYSHELALEPLTGSAADLFDIDATNRGYLLTANKKVNGVKSGSYLELPSGPMQTIADFRRSNALTSAMLPNFVQPVANSYSSPLIATDKFIDPNVVSYPLLDHSVLANHALYDRFYFSTFATYGSAATPARAFAGFMDGSRPLASQSFEPYLPTGMTAEAAAAKLFNGSLPSATAYREAAGHQLVRTPFNVNSVDVEAWKAVLSCLKGEAVQQLWAKTSVRDETQNTGTPLLAMSLVNGGRVGGFNAAQDAKNIDNELTNDYNGYRQLESAQLGKLAEAIVGQIHARGPFLSLAEFVNRQIRPSSPDSPDTLVGALQAAIDESGINDDYLAGHVIPVRDVDVSDPLFFSYPNRQASLGNPAAGAPGWLSQGDIIRLLEPGITVRGDTFVIRTCGQSVDASGKIEATAYAEAVVQRYPEYVDPVDRPSTNVWNPSDGGKSDVNRTFGRRFEIVSFRWLSSGEI
jgi:hypothetical protein